MESAPSGAPVVPVEPPRRRSPVQRFARGLAFLLFSAPQGRAPRTAALATLAICLALFAADRPAFFPRVDFPLDNHASISLSQALGAQYCGKRMLAPRNSIPAALHGMPALSSRSFPDILAWRAGSIDAYCASADLPFLNNENTLMLMMREAFRLNPNLTPAGLGTWLGAIRFVMIAIVVYALLSIGAGVPLVAALAFAAADVLGSLRIYHYSMYTFFVPMLLMVPALLALAYRHLAEKSFYWWAGSFLAAGFVTAFCANMRSSHLPVYIAMFALFAVALALRRPRFWMTAAASVVGFVFGYALFIRIFITPLVPSGPVPFENYSHHVIAHPLVLGLAIPESELSKREGITWNDLKGLELARRMVPDANYLGRGYEEGLFLYYLKLWTLYPGEMRQIYSRKLALAGVGMYATPGFETDRQPLARLLTKFGRIQSGTTMLALYVVLLLASCVYLWRRRRPFALFVSLVCLAAICLLFEGAIIMPLFYLQYHGYLLVSMAFLFALAAQTMLDGIAKYAGSYVRTRRVAGTAAAWPR